MKTVIEMAREAGLIGPEDTAQDIIEYGLELWISGDRGMQTLERFAELVRADAIADEREACAKVCDELIAPDVYSDTDVSMWDVTCIDCAAAIRARGEASIRSNT